MSTERDRSDAPTVAVIGGSGELGEAVSLRLARARVPVIIGSRTRWTGEEAASEIAEIFPDADVRAMLNPDAAEAADFVVLCVPFAHHATAIKSIRDRMRGGQVVVDAVVPLAAAVGGRPTRMLGVWQGSAAEQARDLLPDEVGVVSALHTVSATRLGNLELTPDEDVLVCGDVKEQRQRVIALLERIEGLRAVDCGQLENARIIESMTALLIGINMRHKTHTGVRIMGLPERDLASSVG